jgi:cardiolipin synthase A/B
MSIPPLAQKALRRIPRVVWAFLLILLFCVWFILASLSPHLPDAREPIRLYSNQCQQDLRFTLLEAIRKAQTSIHLVMFGLSDSSILSALAQKAKEKIPLTIYYDPKGSPRVEKILKQGTIHPVQMAALMHQKILILDNEMVFIGSANMTSASLRMHDNLVIGIKNQKIAQFLKEHAPHSPGHLKTTLGGQDLEIWLLPDPRGHVLAEVRNLIRTAQKSLRIALFTFTHPALLEELISAHKRGVHVEVVVDMHSGLGASASTIEQLKKARIPILLSQGVQLLHHKFLYIDERMLLTGSANWTKAAFYKNSDCLVLLRQLHPDQKAFMNKLWSRVVATAK